MVKRMISLKVAIAAILTTILAFSVAFAVWNARQVSHTGIVIVERNFRIYKDFAQTTELTGIDWTNLINRTSQTINVTAYLKNLDVHELYVSWNQTGLPSGIILRMFETGSDVENPPDNMYNLWTYNTLRETIPSTAKRGIRFELTLTPSAPEGTFSFMESFYGWDTET